jgi:glycerol-3-phosphate dehydrogenase (NAD(P)+)
VGTVAVMGAGAWGTALALLHARAGEDVRLWARDPALAERIAATRRNDAYLPGAELPPGILVTADAGRALDGADLVALAVPSVGLRAQLEAWGALVPADTTLASLVKGLEVETGRFAIGSSPSAGRTSRPSAPPARRPRPSRPARTSGGRSGSRRR